MCNTNYLFHEIMQLAVVFSTYMRLCKRKVVLFFAQIARLAQACTGLHNFAQARFLLHKPARKTCITPHKLHALHKPAKSCTTLHTRAFDEYSHSFISCTLRTTLHAFARLAQRAQRLHNFAQACKKLHKPSKPEKLEKLVRIRYKPHVRLSDSLLSEAWRKLYQHDKIYQG